MKTVHKIILVLIAVRLSIMIIFDPPLTFGWPIANLSKQICIDDCSGFLCFLNCNVRRVLQMDIAWYIPYDIKLKTNDISTKVMNGVMGFVITPMLPVVFLVIVRFLKNIYWRWFSFFVMGAYFNLFLQYMLENLFMSSCFAIVVFFNSVDLVIMGLMIWQLTDLVFINDFY
jgi:hypothetical protein